MKHPFFYSALFALGFASTAFPARAAQADFNEVGKQMAILLQNRHIARLPYNAMGQRFLDSYLAKLDPGKVYFTKEDVDRFSRDYGTKLAGMLLKGDSMKAARDIHGVFRQRVEARVAEAGRLLAAKSLDFTADESVQLRRKDAAWPQDEAAAMALWRLQFKDSVLTETLRQRELAAAAAKEGKENPLAGGKEPLEKIALRYRHYLQGVMKDGAEDEVAALFLSAVAHAFDPHTDYFSSRELAAFQDEMRNEFAGIGAVLQNMEDGSTEVAGIMIGGPVDRQSELKLKDRIVAVDPDGDGPQEMVDIQFMSVEEVSRFVRGPVDTPLRMKTKRPGGAAGATALVDIKRAKVTLKNSQASAAIIEVKPEGGDAARLGIITLPLFYSDFEAGKVSCATDVERLLERLKTERIDGLLLDLRDNGGGALREVVRMTGFFCPPGPVVQVRDIFGEVEVKESARRAPIYDGPMIVLTNKGSASASEILAGALQDANRAVVVGESTFGKGTVQYGPEDLGRLMPFFGGRDNAGGLKITQEKFYRPAGSSTQLKGVKPDIALPGSGDALEMGEAFYPHPLEHDLIKPAPNFAPLRREQLFLSRLQERSAARVAGSKDFAYLAEDLAMAKTRLRENRASLQLTVRQKELAEKSARQQQRNAEREARFAAMQKSDRNTFGFYKLTLDDVARGGGAVKYDPGAVDDTYIRRAEGDTGNPGGAPQWPSGLDPQEREGIAVLGDLVAANRDASFAAQVPK